jgi:hypothetical protein
MLRYTYIIRRKTVKGHDDTIYVCDYQKTYHPVCCIVFHFLETDVYIHRMYKCGGRIAITPEFVCGLYFNITTNMTISSFLPLNKPTNLNINLSRDLLITEPVL